MSKNGCFVSKEDLRKMKQYADLAPMSYDTFNDFYQQILDEEGVLPVKVWELVALGAAHALKCQTCIHLHTKKALKAGASKQEITEAIFVSSLIGSSSVLTNGITALKAMEEEDD